MFVWAAEALAPSENEEDNNLGGAEDRDDLGGFFNDLLSGNTDEEIVDEEPTDEETVVVSGDDELTVSLDPQTPSDGLAQADVARVPLLVFNVQAGSEDVTLNQATFEFIGLGDYNKLDSVSIYNSKGEKVSKSKSFSEVTREISFDNNVVIEAGTTMILTVAGKLSTGGAENATYGIKLIDLEASSDVDGADVTGALLVPAIFSNIASLKVEEDKAT
jgi:hypothetical protein